MNPAQLARQIKHRLVNARWTAGSAELVFGERGVQVFSGQPSEDQLPTAIPWALISIDGSESDEDAPEYLTQRFTVLVAALVRGDRVGEAAVIGGNSADFGKSANRGVAELAAEARRAVQSLTGIDGARILVGAVTSSPVLPLTDGRHIAMAEIELAAQCTAQPFFTAPQRLRYQVSKWAWDGDHCEARHDFWRYVLVRKPGTAPSVDPFDGTTIYTGTVASFTGTQSNGSIYTVFAQYNSRGSGVLEGSSDPEVGAFLVPS